MTSPPPPAEQRAALQQVTAAAVASLTQLWPDLDVTNGLALKEALKAILPPLLDQYGTAASTLAADVYDILRDAAGITDPFNVPILDPDITAVLNRTIGWAVGPVFSRDPDPDLALQYVSGGVQKLVADQYRDTIQDASIADPKATGWQREARATGCDFCRMLAGRGAVYSSKTVDFGAHRDCHCLAVPAFIGQAMPVKPYAVSNRRKLDADGKPVPISKADRDRVRRWIAEHQ